MISATNQKINIYYGKSTEKPSQNIHNGDEFFSVDTNEHFIYDEENNIWIKIETLIGDFRC